MRVVCPPPLLPSQASAEGVDVVVDDEGVVVVDGVEDTVSAVYVCICISISTASVSVSVSICASVSIVTIVGAAAVTGL